MSLEIRVQLLILVAFAIAFVFNWSALAYTYHSSTLVRTLAQERPFTRAGVKGVIALVVVNNIGLVLLTMLLLLRNYFVLPVATEEGYWFIPPLVILSSIVFYAMNVWPATMLFFLSWAIKEHDKLVQMKLERHKKAATKKGKWDRGARTQ